jgi:glycerol uptake facilitator-like aquaporin
VTAVLIARKDMKMADAFFYVLVQIAGAILGAITANIMFGLPAVEFSENDRINAGTFLGEVIATAGLIVIIVVSLQRSVTHLLPLLVPAWIGAAYFFTSSTSFANPAVTIGRMFTDTFTGIAPASVPWFIVAQILGAVAGGLLGLFFSRSMTQQKVSS